MSVFYMKKLSCFGLKHFCKVLSFNLFFLSFCTIFPAEESSAVVPHVHQALSQPDTSSDVFSQLRRYAPYVGAGLAVAGIGAVAGYHYLTKKDDEGLVVENFQRIALDDQFYFREVRLSRLCRNMTESERIWLVNDAIRSGDLNNRRRILEILQRNGLLSSDENFRAFNMPTELAIAQPKKTNEIEAGLCVLLNSVRPCDISFYFPLFRNQEARASERFDRILSGSEFDSSKYTFCQNDDKRKNIITNAIKVCAFKGVTPSEREAFFENRNSLMIALSADAISIDEIRVFFPDGNEQVHDYMSRIFNKLDSFPQTMAEFCEEIKGWRSTFTKDGLSAAGLVKLIELCDLLQIQPRNENASTEARTSEPSRVIGWPYEILINTNCFSRDKYGGESQIVHAVKLCTFKGVTSAVREAFFDGSRAFRVALQSEEISVQEIVVFFPHDELQDQEYFLRILNHMKTPGSDLSESGQQKLLTLADALNINLWRAHPHVRGLESCQILIDNFIRNSNNLEDKNGLAELAEYLAKKIHFPEFLKDWQAYLDSLPRDIRNLEMCMHNLDEAYYSVLLKVFYQYVLGKFEEVNGASDAPDLVVFAEICDRIEPYDFSESLLHLRDDVHFRSRAWRVVRLLRQHDMQIPGGRVGEMLAVHTEMEKEVFDLYQRSEFVFPIELGSNIYTCITDLCNSYGYDPVIYFMLRRVLEELNGTDKSEYQGVLAKRADVLLDSVRCLKAPKDLPPLWYMHIIIQALEKLSAVGIKPNALLNPGSKDAKTIFQDCLIRTESFNDILPLCEMLTREEFDDEMLKLQASQEFKEWFSRSRSRLEDARGTSVYIEKVIKAGENALTHQGDLFSRLLKIVDAPAASTSSS